jgi:HEAT repeat protein
LNRVALLSAALASVLLAAFLFVLPRALARGKAAREPTDAARPAVVATAPGAAAPAASPGRPLLEARTPAEVRSVVRYSSAAGEGSVAELRKMAEADDPLVAGNAVRALGRLGASPADGTMEDLLRDARPRVRQEAVVALGLARDERAVAVLERVLEEGEPDLGPLAIQALGQIGGLRARSVLERRLEDPSTTDVERVFARRALEEWR